MKLTAQTKSPARLDWKTTSTWEGESAREAALWLDRISTGQRRQLPHAGKPGRLLRIIASGLLSQP
jgi:hypothetical protein